MAYGGYLVKINKLNEQQVDYKIPHEFIKADSYSVSHNTQDLDPDRDANGVLHRNALAHKIIKIEFNTVPMLTDAKLNVLLSNIEARYKDTNEKKVSITAYSPADREYITQDCYLVDLEISPYWADKNMIQYQPIRFAFVGY